MSKFGESIYIWKDANPYLIQLNRAYGPLPTSFRLILKEGYSVFIGRNNSGKSGILQRIFVHFCQRGEFGVGAVCYLGPDRQYVNSRSPPPASLAQYNNDLLQQIMNAPLQLVGEKMLGTCNLSDRPVRARQLLFFPAATHRCSGMIRLVERDMVSHLAAHTVQKTEGLAVEFGCGLRGDECQFF